MFFCTFHKILYFARKHQKTNFSQAWASLSYINRNLWHTFFFAHTCPMQFVSRGTKKFQIVTPFLVCDKGGYRVPAMSVRDMWYNWQINRYLKHKQNVNKLSYKKRYRRKNHIFVCCKRNIQLGTSSYEQLLGF